MKALLFLLALLCIPAAHAETELTTLDGDPLVLPETGWVHLVFFDLWASYGDNSVRQTIAALPESFNKQTTTVWIQPRMNVTDAQLHEFQQQFTEVSPLVVDEGFELMRRYGHWQLPAHVILHNGDTVFSGNSHALQDYVTNLNHNNKP